MDGWQTILTTAILGTSREPPVFPVTDEPIGQTVSHAAADGEPPSRLLRAAAVLGTARLAGFVPGAIAGPDTPAEVDRRPACSAAAASCLSRMLAGEQEPVLPECLTLLAQAGRRVPHALLPDLLGVAVRDRFIQLMVRGVIDERGLWLMNQNEEWHFDIAADPAKDWETGKCDQRVTALRRMRERDPAEALEKLGASWPQETPEDRVALLECVAVGLSMADEPFLEDALDDRRKDVRRAAVDLLARLPESRLVLRMTERLRVCLAVQVTERRGLLGLGAKRSAVSLHVTLPEACDRAMTRDGIDAKPPTGSRIGEKAWWLQQMLASVPPETVANGAPVEAFVEAATATDWADAVCGGWTLAAARSGSADWAAAMLRHQLDQPVNLQDVGLAERLAGVLTVEAREAVAIWALDDHQVDVTAPAARGLLLVCRSSWGEALSGAVLESLCGSPRTDPSWLHMFRLLAPLFGAVIATTLQPQLSLLAELPGDGVWVKAMEKLVETVRFRAIMQQAIKEI